MSQNFSAIASGSRRRGPVERAALHDAEDGDLADVDAVAAEPVVSSPTSLCCAALADRQAHGAVLDRHRVDRRRSSSPKPPSVTRTAPFSLFRSGSASCTAARRPWIADVEDPRSSPGLAGVGRRRRRRTRSSAGADRPERRARLRHELAYGVDVAEIARKRLRDGACFRERIDARVQALRRSPDESDRVPFRARSGAPPRRRCPSRNRTRGWSSPCRLYSREGYASSSGT